MDQTPEEPMEIDDSLYSRQRYVLGDHAMHEMARSSVFLSGLGGLGVEIAKNIVLAGVKSITLHDTQAASMLDLSSQFFLREEDVANGRNRVEASLARLAELNPYVTVRAVTHPFSITADLSTLAEYQCVILTDAPLDLQLRVDDFCRTQNPPIKFVSCSVRGVFSSVFCDFGPEFTVVDSNGEEPVECFVGAMSQGCPGEVSCLEQGKHGLEAGDRVVFKEVVGMTGINGTTHTIDVLSATKFTIGDTTALPPYQHGGIARQVKVAKTTTFSSLREQLARPSVLLTDFAKMAAPLQSHLAFLTLDRFLAQRDSLLPRPRDETDAEVFVELAKTVNEEYKLVEEVDATFQRWFSQCACGCLPPLATAVGGVVAQEALIALTGKFSPLQQWMFLDATEILQGVEKCDPHSFQQRGDRYDAVRVCLGEELLQKLANLKLFMVGCGAIGCEMLKNYAMLGVARKPAGLLHITDNDLIEKSNLNRQFLFRPRHIQKPKSVVAAQSTLDINPELVIDAQQYKVYPGTEERVYHDSFYQSLSLVVNALDNVEARRYIDGRCVSNQRPLLESGTMGAKGHVQVIIPHLTESYSSQQDPPEKDVPYCTLKSFPASIEHTIQWARDKFEALFAQKPAMYSKFWEIHKTPEAVLERMQAHSTPDGVVQVVKMLRHRPADWAACIATARIQFDKYFNHKAKNLLNAFPLDTRMKDGSLFWQSPKRPPIPLQFDFSNAIHASFVISLAKLLAAIHGIAYTQQDLAEESILRIIQSIKVPEYKHSSKHVETDESAKKPVEVQLTGEVVEEAQAQLMAITAAASGTLPRESLRMFPQSFEKDDDSNGHIDFITAASNLRAAVYSIEPVDRFRTKLIAGRIVPAIATTTAAVAGLVSIELVKVVMALPLESYKNAFLNLALPSLIFSEPAPPIKSVFSPSCSYTLWDKWEIRGSQQLKLKDFIRVVKEQYGLEPAMIVLGVKMVYVPMMPGHRKRLPQTMLQLLKPSPTKKYVDLTASFENDQGEDIAGPPIRYYFQ